MQGTQGVAHAAERTNENVITVRHEGILSEWSQSYLLLADVHFDNPHCRRDILMRLLNQARARNAGILVFGDWFCAMQGRWDPRANKESLRPEHRTGNYLDALVDSSLELLEPYADLIVMMGDGNHECYDAETEVLTDSGWKLFKDLDRAERIATLNLDTECVEWQSPTSYHVSHFTGKMHQIKARGANFVVTPNHRIVHRPQGKLNHYAVKRSYDFSYSKGSQITIPVSAMSGNAEYEQVTDDELRLLGWILTDGSIKTYGGSPIPRVQLYQRAEKVNLIISILNRLGYEYAYRERKRITDHIQGKKLKKREGVECTITLQGDGKARVLHLLHMQREIPKWMHLLSDRQFEVFLASFIDGDGSRHKSAPSSCMAYGEKEMLENLQALCVTHGYKASLATYRERHYRLNITKHLDYCLRNVGSRFSQTDYDGPVYCLTVPNGTMFVRRHGYVCVSGNTAIRKHLETDLLERLCRGLNVTHMGYSGFTRFLFQGTAGRRTRRILYWHHGHGGGGPVTKGVIQTNRRAVYLPDAHIVVSGHVHEEWQLTIPRVRLSHSGDTYLDEQVHVQLPTLKDEFAMAGGWHVERGAPPKPLGGAWLTFRYSGQTMGHIEFEIVRAK